MTAPNVGSHYVPAQGPVPASIMVVGEAPGVEEEDSRLPFIGKSGQLLNHQLQRHGIQREDIFVTNICHYRPKNNKFVNVIGTPELGEGLEELKTDIERVQPKVIIACGGWPLHYLTGVVGKTGKPGTGILNWRGSVLPCALVPGYKVLATVHPAFVLRSWGFNPILHFDLGKALKQSEFPEINYPQYESIIDPQDDELLDLIGQMKGADYVSIDIETFGPGQMSCIGFTDSASRGLCVTIEKAGGFETVQSLYEDKVPKIFQYGTYDINFLRHFYGWKVGGYYNNLGHDTYVAAATLMPEFPRGLDFLTSIYTDFPYYKEERKVWKEDGDKRTLWEYNIKDIIATYIIAMEQMEELKG